MRLDYTKNNDVGVISIAGRLDAESVSDFKTDFASHLEEVKKFVLDLKEMDAIDSTGLGGIVACMKYAIEAGGDMKIASLATKPKMVFEITRAYKIFDIYNSLTEAVESYYDGKEPAKVSDS